MNSAKPTDAGGDNELRQALNMGRRTFAMAIAFSCIINLLMLTGPVFMLQVYDRVLSSRSIPTLLTLFAIVAALYAVHGILEAVRAKLFTRIGLKFDEHLGDRVFDTVIQMGTQTRAGATRALKELAAIRQFLTGNGPFAFLDAPWSPIFLGVLFMFHWILGTFALAAAIVLACLAVLSQVRTKKFINEQTELQAKSAQLADSGARNAEVLIAMGMQDAYRRRWQEANSKALIAEANASDRLGAMSSFSKALRLLLQSAMLGLGAWLTIKGEVTAGAIIAGSILMGRALAPVEQVIGSWRGLVRARAAFQFLAGLLDEMPAPTERLELPAPKGHLQATNLAIAPPKSKTLSLNGANFEIEPGAVLGVLGASASGKSCLARVLVGIWLPVGGEVRIDGVKPNHWQPGALGRHIGYLPQDVELFDGTVKQNISRFSADAEDEAVLRAAQLANVHEMIAALPEAYETELGAYGSHISAGQRQRIGLARALYGDPALIVLDEPNSNLDSDGEAALAEAIKQVRENGQTVVIIAHRSGILNLADYLLVLNAGKQVHFGTRQEVIQALQNANAPPRNDNKGPLKRVV